MRNMVIVMVVFSIGLGMLLSNYRLMSRQALMEELHSRSVQNIGLQQVVVSGGMSDFIPGEDADFRAVFQRADSLMYQEKKLLKSLGARTRQ